MLNYLIRIIEIGKCQMKEIFLGIDIGTTAIKFGVISDNQLLFEVEKNLETFNGDHGECYQLVSEIQQAIIAGVKEIPENLRKAIEKIGFSVAMHSIMPDVENRLFIWSDNQSRATIKAFKKTEKADAFYLKTGTPIHTMSPFAKILHFNQQQVYEHATRWFGLKELAMDYFTGEFVVDYSTASATGLFNLESRTWDEEILAYVGIHNQQLAKLVDTTTGFAILPEVAKELGLEKEPEIVIGGTDGVLAAYASYAGTGMENSLTVGTSAAIRSVTKKPLFDKEKQNFCYYLNQDLYVIGAPSNNGGCVLAWAGQTLADDAGSFYADLHATLEKSNIGANGLRFHPYINGERAPFWSDEKTAEFRWLTIRHTKEDMIRAVVEGIIMNLRLLKGIMGEMEQLALSGGFFQVDILTKLTADILGVDCWLSASNEPIFGLYYLIYGTEGHEKKPTRHIIYSQEDHLAYQEFAESYFD